MLSIVKRYTAKETLLLIAIRSPADGRPYWSGRRGANASAKVAGVIVMPGSGMAYKTDLWVGPTEHLVLGGRTCKSCHKRTLADGKCPSCGGPLTQIRFRLSEKESAEIKEMKHLEAGDFPFSLVGVTAAEAGGGIFAGNKESGDDPLYGIPDEIRETAELLLARGRDIVNLKDPRREQILIIPQARDVQVCSSLESLKSVEGVEISL